MYKISEFLKLMDKKQKYIIFWLSKKFHKCENIKKKNAMLHPLSAKVGSKFADKQWLLGRYSLLAD
jgi:hypothetical protein